MEYVQIGLAVLSGLLVGVIAGLKVIAPLTKTKKDDALIAPLETAESVVEHVRDATKK